MEWPIPSIESTYGPIVPEWHDVVSVTLGELVEDGWIALPSDEWDFPKLDDEQHARLCAKIIDRYYYREICAMPPGIWRRMFLRKLNEIMPKYIPLYEQVANIDPLQVGNDYGKSREVFSDYPATRLAANQDYASTGTDRQYEDIHQGNPAEQVRAYARGYDDVDVLILDELDVCFTSLCTLNVNAL